MTKKNNFDDHLENKISNDKVDTKSEVIEMEENMNDEINCPAFSDEFMDGSKEVNQVSISDFENYSQNDEVLLEATVEVLQPIFKLLID